MVTRAAVSVVVAVGFLTAAGCGPAKLDETRTYTLDPKADSARALDLPAQPKPQTVTVEYTSSEDGIEVGLYKAADVGKDLLVTPSKALKAEKGKKSGTLVGTTRVWNQLVDGRWLSDYYVSNPSNTTFSAPVPRCP